MQTSNLQFEVKLTLNLKIFGILFKHRSFNRSIKDLSSVYKKQTKLIMNISKTHSINFLRERNKKSSVSMAASKTYYARSNYRYLFGERDDPIGTDSMFELDESDIWNVSSSPELRKTAPSSRISKKSSPAVVKRGEIGGTVSYLPVNVPDWSKILKEDYRENRRRDKYLNLEIFAYLHRISGLALLFHEVSRLERIIFTEIIADDRRSTVDDAGRRRWRENVEEPIGRRRPSVTETSDAVRSSIRRSNGPRSLPEI